MSYAINNYRQENKELIIEYIVIMTYEAIVTQ